MKPQRLSRMIYCSGTTHMEVNIVANKQGSSPGQTKMEGSGGGRFWLPNLIHRPRQARWGLCAVVDAVAAYTSIVRRRRPILIQIDRPEPSVVFSSPARKSIVGFHPSFFSASEMSGPRCVGSSAGSGRITRGSFEAVISSTNSAQAHRFSDSLYSICSTQDRSE